MGYLIKKLLSDLMLEWLCFAPLGLLNFSGYELGLVCSDGDST